MFAIPKTKENGKQKQTRANNVLYGISNREMRKNQRVIVPKHICKTDKEYFTQRLVGNCLDSKNAPKKIKNNQMLLMYKEDKYQFERYFDKTVSIVFNNFTCIAKHYVSYDELSSTITLKMYNPERIFKVRVANIKHLFVVEDVLDNPEIIISEPIVI